MRTLTASARILRQKAQLYEKLSKGEITEKDQVGAADLISVRTSWQSAHFL